MTLDVKPEEQSEDVKKLWCAVLNELELQMTKGTFNTWLKGTSATHADEPDTWLVHLHNSYAQDWIENRLRDTIQRTVLAIVGKPISLKFVVTPDIQPGSNGRNHQEAETPQPQQKSPIAGMDTSQYSPEELAQIEAALKRKSKRADVLDVAPDDELIDIIMAPVEDDLLATGFLIIPHYVVRFWKPYLGNLAFDTLLVLSSYWNEQGQDDDPDPEEAGFSIADLEQMVGASRHSILGRNARAGRKPVVGAIEILERENLLVHFVTGEGKGTRHHFMIRPLYRLPLLTKTQVEILPKQLKNEHEKYLSKKKRHINIEAWEADGRQTRVPQLR